MPKGAIGPPFDPMLKLEANMTERREAWIIDGVRTPRGRGKPTGALHHIHPQELLAQCLNALVARTGIDPADIADVIVGNGNSVGDHGDCIGRLAVLAAGWPQQTPGFTINRFCGSGQQAVTLAAMGVISGMQDLVVGGGVESMSRWPQDPTPPTIDGDNPALRAKYPTVPQGISADLIATLEGFSRQDCDEFALRSQQRAARAIAEDRFARSVIPVRNPDGSIALDHEEHPRPDTTLEALAQLPPSFAAMGQQRFPDFEESFDEMCLRVYPQIDRIDHVHHAGNSSGVVDGASAVLVASSDFARAHGLTPRARIRMTAVAGDEPVIMLTAPAPAAKRCLAKAGMTVDDIDLWEINEAFAAVVLKAIRDLRIDPEKVNPNGGAIALGHPIGATGGMLIQTALDELERRDGETALIVMCTGGGMATATIIERV
jgi:acetyl-CoA C-acetyltransferase